MVEEIDIKKEFNEILRRSRMQAKLDNCLCCGKKMTSFCNSHTLPKFILKSISDNGMVYTSNNYFKMPLADNEIGLKNSGTFKRICKECDSVIFQDYEEVEKLLVLPRKKVMTQIDLKNTLRMYEKRLNEIELYNIMISEYANEYNFLDLLSRQHINEFDLDEIKKEFERDMKILKKESTSSFELIYWKILDYVTPIAFQGHIALHGDLNGNIINDLYNIKKDYVIENLNLCVFPLEDKTVIIMFVNKDNRKYNNFIKQFKKLKEDEKLRLISFIIFNYSEDFFISKKSKDSLLNNPILDMLTQNTTDIYALDEEMAKEFKNIKKFELMNYKICPNILDVEYAIKQQSSKNSQKK